MRLLATNPAERPVDIAAARQLLRRTEEPKPIPRPSASD